VGAALHRRVVGDDDASAPVDLGEAGRDARRWSGAVVEVRGGERAQLHERRAGIGQPGDAIAREQLAPLDVAPAGLLASAGPGARQAGIELVDQCEVLVAVAHVLCSSSPVGSAPSAVTATSACPSSTRSPGASVNPATVPARGAVIESSIFIDSSTS